MHTLGLITEYNPFHNGHQYHIEQAKNITGATHVVAVMSGNFVQRGEPAILDKWTRAKAALCCGVDLVLELPAVYATSSAEYFAGGSIRLLRDLGIIDHVVFGSESDDMETLRMIARILVEEPADYQHALKKALSEGCAFPAAREQALLKYLRVDQLPTTPNDILGIEYAKAILSLNADIQTHTIKRIGAGYHDLNIQGAIASATGIRNATKIGHFEEALRAVPATIKALYKDALHHSVYPDHLFPYLQYALRTASHASLLGLPDVVEGLEHKLLKCASCADWDDLIATLKSKRYTQTRIQRILLSLFIQKSKVLQEQSTQLDVPLYARVLGFTDRGRDILRAIKDKESAHLITKPHRFDTDHPVLQDMHDLDIRCTNLYALLSPSVSMGDDFRRQPVYHK